MWVTSYPWGVDSYRTLLIGATLLALAFGGCVRLGFGVEGSSPAADGATDFPVDDAQNGTDGRLDGRADGPLDGNSLSDAAATVDAPTVVKT